MLEDGEIKLEGSPERLKKLLKYTDKLILHHNNKTRQKVIDFVDRYIRTSSDFKSSIDKCDRGIHYVRIKAESKHKTLPLIKLMEREGLDYELVPYELEDLVYSKFTRSICDGFEMIDLKHISPPKKTVLKSFFNAYWAMGYLYIQKLKCRFTPFFIATTVYFLSFVFYVIHFGKARNSGSTDFTSGLITLMSRKLTMFRAMTSGYISKEVTREMVQGQRYFFVDVKALFVHEWSFLFPLLRCDQFLRVFVHRSDFLNVLLHRHLVDRAPNREL
jgi:hypothetical protein